MAPNVKEVSMGKISQAKVVNLEPIKLGGIEEYVLRGGRELLSKLPEVYDGIKQIVIIGWSVQKSAQAQNLREWVEYLASLKFFGSSGERVL
jgi:hypothetical protein